MGMEVFMQKERNSSQAPIQLAQPFPTPELRAKKIYGHEDFSEPQKRDTCFPRTTPPCLDLSFHPNGLWSDLAP